jgi:hypothetical protein
VASKKAALPPPPAQQELPTADDLGLAPIEPAEEQPTDVVGATEAGAAGAARGVSLGLSDLALANIPTDMKGTPLVSPEKLEQLKSEHPTASAAGEYGSLLIPVAGEIGALGKAAKVAKTASGAFTATSAVGDIIGQVTQKAIANQIVGKLAGGAAKTAAEALIYNAGQNLSEAVLGDQDITAERLLAHGGQALIFGGGLGFGMHGAGMALEAATQKAQSSIGKLQTFIDQNVKERLLNRSAERVSAEQGIGAGEARAKIDSLFSQQKVADADGISLEKVVARDEKAAAQEQMQTAAEERDRMQRAFQENLTDTWKSVNSAKKQLWGDIRPKEVDSLLEHADVSATSNAAHGLTSKLDETINKLKSDPTAFDQAYVRDLEAVRAKLQKKLVDEGVSSSAEVYNLINGLKKTELSDLSEFGRDLGNATRATSNSLREVRGVYKSFASHLEDESVYGAAAIRQGAINEAFTGLERITGKGSSFRKFFMEKVGGKYELSPTKINTYFGKVESARAEAATTALKQYVDAAKTFTDEVANSNATAGVSGFNKEGLKSLLEKVQTQQAEAAEKLGASSRARASFPSPTVVLPPAQNVAGGGLAGLALPVVGHAIGGAVGGAVASGAAGAMKLAQTINDPYKLVAALSHLEAASKQTTRGIERGISGFLRGTEAAAKVGRAVGAAPHLAAVESEPSPLLHHRMGEGSEHDDKHQAFKHAQGVLAQVQADPMGVADKMAKGLQRMDAAPGVKQSVIANQMKAMSFLAAKVPRNPFAGYPGQQNFQPASSEMAKFERYVRAASDPMTVLHDLQRGTVTPEAVETLENVYPKMFEQMQKTLLERTPEMDALPYAKRIQLSLLFKVPLDPSLKPEVMGPMQERLAGAGKQDDPQQPAGPKQIKGPPLHIAQGYSTPAMKREMREAQ